MEQFIHKSILAEDINKDNMITLTTSVSRSEKNGTDIVVQQSLSFITSDQVIEFNLSGDMLILSEKLKSVATEIDNVLFAAISSIAEEDAENAPLDTHSKPE